MAYLTKFIDDEGNEATVIELDGLAERVERVPLPFENYVGL